MKRVATILAGCALAACLGTQRGTELRVGSKKFTESVILGEMVTLLARNAGAKTIHRRELGGTRLLWNALLAGDIDIYPEYTGTIIEEIFRDERPSDENQLRVLLRNSQIEMSRPLGFNNTYALGVREDMAERLGLRAISDLRRHPGLVLGFSNEFLNRGDGWPALRRRYGLPHGEVRGMDHDLAYRGLEAGSVSVVDLYSTDAEIEFYHLRILIDDLHFFTEYQAVLLFRADLRRGFPEVVQTLGRLEGAIDESAMIALNRGAKMEGVSERRLASNFLTSRLGVDLGSEADLEERGAAARVLGHVAEHLWLVLVSLVGAILVSIPLGILAARTPWFGHGVLAVVGVVQTIPSLALLVFMIPLFGIGAPPAIFALFVYSLLPIVRNTYTGLRDIPDQLKESAEALGLPRAAILRRVELPLASPTILAGIKTSAVINVGTATLGALVGAGGLGQPILTGIRLADIGLILQGAVPAALLALAAQGLFDLAERFIVPKGLRGSRRQRV